MDMTVREPPLLKYPWCNTSDAMDIGPPLTHRFSLVVVLQDLSCLNRDLSRVILVDVNKDSYKLNPRNGMTLKKWNGKDDDRELYDLAALLHSLYCWLFSFLIGETMSLALRHCFLKQFSVENYS